MKKIARIIVNICLSILGIFVVVLLLEVLARLFLQPHPYTNFNEPHEQLGRFFIPGQEGWAVGDGFDNYIKINSHGLRDEEHSYVKAEGIFRILVLADSFGAAFQVPLEDTFHKVAQNLLNQSAEGRRFEFINGSFPGWGTTQELKFFQVEGYRYQPDLVLLMFYPGNDVLDNAQSQQKAQLPSRTTPKAEQISHNLKIWLTKNSRLYTYVNRTVKLHAPLWLLNILQKAGLLGTVRPLIQEYVPTDYLVYSSQYSSDWENAWAITEKVIRSLRMEVEKYNAKFSVVIITDREQVHPTRWHEALSTYPAMRSREWDLDKPNRLLASFLKKEGIVYFDLLPAFRDYAREHSVDLHYHYDSHWNAQGHRLAGELISKWLIAKKMVPTKGGKP